PARAEIERLTPAAGPRLVFADGRYVPELSSFAGLPDGVYAGSLAAALQAGPSGELARAHLTRLAHWRDSAFAALNTAFLADGAFVHVPAGCVLAQPLEVVCVATAGGSDGPKVAHPRGLIVVERGAQAVVVETFASLGDGVHWTNAVSEVVVGEGARVERSEERRVGKECY